MKQLSGQERLLEYREESEHSNTLRNKNALISLGKYRVGLLHDRQMNRISPYGITPPGSRKKAMILTSENPYAGNLVIQIETEVPEVETLAQQFKVDTQGR